MNISQAKTQIKYAVQAYLSKNELGEYDIPLERQRPVFLVGPPGIGKTAIMAQIAQELHIGLVSYSMTHHTRQSALGLPFIAHKAYRGKEYDVTEYTMSEIIASVYDVIEETGVQEGILFLDEINCVSETLTPVMLQFLQYKEFGRHRVPDGWVVVTAGNPPEYNNSVREYDVVTLDRVKRMDVEPDFAVWKAYASVSGVHPAILTYLALKNGDFYRVENTISGKRFVTARSWCDLSDMLHLFEKNGLPVDETLISQYLQEDTVAGSFAAYYDLYRGYAAEYRIEAILAGEADADTKAKAAGARFDERLSLLGMLLERVKNEVGAVLLAEQTDAALLGDFKRVRLAKAETGAGAEETLTRRADELRLQIGLARRSGAVGGTERKVLALEQAALQAQLQKLSADPEDPEQTLQKDLTQRRASCEKAALTAAGMLENLFRFCEEVFGGQEMTVVVTELTADKNCLAFLQKHGSDAYYRHAKELLLQDRKAELLSEIGKIGL